ncbi:MAG: type 1 glutamine amidotransferase [Pseudomonadota bacterium]
MKPQRAHWLQHAEHEDSGCIEPWLISRGHQVTHTRLFAGESLPDASSFDWLIIMGGPMNIYEHDRHPWLIPEKKLINDAIVTNKKILGICLGSQLLSDVLGGAVTKNKYQEIGWFKVELTEDGVNSPYSVAGHEFLAFHWHGDTYALPPQAKCLARSEACGQQAFSHGARRLGLQFHLEVTVDDAREWLKVDAPKPERYVQSVEEILRDPTRFSENNRLMRKLLEQMEAIHF